VRSLDYSPPPLLVSPRFLKTTTPSFPPKEVQTFEPHSRGRPFFCKMSLHYAFCVFLSRNVILLFVKIGPFLGSQATGLVEHRPALCGCATRLGFLRPLGAGVTPHLPSLSVRDDLLGQLLSVSPSLPPAPLPLTRQHPVVPYVRQRAHATVTENSCFRASHFPAEEPFPRGGLVGVQSDPLIPYSLFFVVDPFSLSPDFFIQHTFVFPGSPPPGFLAPQLAMLGRCPPCPSLFQPGPPPPSDFFFPPSFWPSLIRDACRRPPFFFFPFSFWRRVGF